jgi:hypothetical protein
VAASRRSAMPQWKRAKAAEARMAAAGVAEGADSQASLHWLIGTRAEASSADLAPRAGPARLAAAASSTVAEGATGPAGRRLERTSLRAPQVAARQARAAAAAAIDWRAGQGPGARRQKGQEG